MISLTSPHAAKLQAHTGSPSCVVTPQVSGRVFDPHMRLNPLSRPAALPQKNIVQFSPRIRLVPLAIARWILGLDAESVIKRVDNAVHPNHIRFAFDISADKNRSARELRFFIGEMNAPELMKKGSIKQAIAEILGTHPTFSRGDIEIQWITSSNQVSRLVQAGHFKQNGNRISRASLEAFLLARWSGNNPI